jgi:hypothetical protein
VEITIDPKGVRLSAGRQKAHAEYAGKDWGHREISSALLKINLPALQAAGWTVETTDKQIVLKNSRS